jgi:hypothetical protein
MIGKNPLFVARQHGHSLVTMWRTYAVWMDGALESDIGLIRAAIEGSAPELVPSSVQRDSAAQVELTLAERLSNTASGLPRDGALVAEFGTRFVTRCGRPGTAARPPLRSGPSRVGRDVQKSLRDFCRTGGFVHTPCSVKIKSPRTGFLFLPMAERVGLLGALRLAPPGPPWRALSPLRCCRGQLLLAESNLCHDWRRGWDSNPRRHR